MSNWICRYCNHAQALVDSRNDVGHQHLWVEGSKFGNIGIQTHTFVCSNPECREITLSALLVKDVQSHDWQASTKSPPIFTWNLLPESSAKPQPEFIPGPLREDYYEACAIRDLSPKASATLSRRCLQGMIRDFCKIARRTLDAEITALRAAIEDGTAPRGVTEESVDAIDAVRTVGNIGAHMEKDIDLIVEVDPGEAQVLIDLIESLFDEWYVARERRQQKFAAVRAVADDKRTKLEHLRGGAASNALPAASQSDETT